MTIYAQTLPTLDRKRLITEVAMQRWGPRAVRSKRGRHRGSKSTPTSGHIKSILPLKPKSRSLAWVGIVEVSFIYTAKAPRQCSGPDIATYISEVVGVDLHVSFDAGLGAAMRCRHLLG